jgi:class 3 adenylate cyclase
MPVVSEISGEGVAAEMAQLVEYLRSLGATETELEEALARGVEAMGPLALDLAIRPSGSSTTREEFLSGLGLKGQLAHRVWRACGLPEVTEFPFPVTPDLADAIALLVGFADLLGEDTLVGLTRVLGASIARMAEALSDTTRIGVEVPQRESGMAYPEVVRDYSNLAHDGLPLLFDAIAALFRRHLVLVAYQSWSADAAGATVTLDRTVGFADLVSSTELLVPLNPAQIASMIDHFERDAWDTVTRAGGRFVKLIGDEAMFVHADPREACEIARELVTSSRHPIRVGLARGDVVALHGDYYGPTVNLAARLAGASPASAVVVSETVKVAGDDLHFEPIDLGPLKGFVNPGRIYRLTTD